MHVHPRSSGGWLARHQAACSRCRQTRARCGSRAYESADRWRREALVLAGPPWITARQRLLRSRDRGMCCVQYGIACPPGRFTTEVVAAWAVVVVFVVVAGLVPAVARAVPKPTAAAATVVKPA